MKTYEKVGFKIGGIMEAQGGLDMISLLRHFFFFKINEKKNAQFSLTWFSILFYFFRVTFLERVG